MSERGYEKTLQSVADCTGGEMVDTMAEHIKDRIESENERPENQSVRREARKRLAEKGIAPDDYLHRA